MSASEPGTTVERPAPAVGQRWRGLCGDVWRLARSLDSNDWWECVSEAGVISRAGPNFFAHTGVYLGGPTVAAPASATGVAPMVAVTRARCNIDGCDEVEANPTSLMCEAHIAEAMVFSDGCRLKPVLFPAVPEHRPQSLRQSHLLGVGCSGTWNLRGR